MTSPLAGYSRLDASAIAGLVRGREVSATEVVEAALDAMERLDGTLAAFCTPTPDMARAAAQELDRRLAGGAEAGPLAGVPVAVKDLILTAGVRTTSGSALYADFVPRDDDIVVERLKAADAIIIGKTNVSEFGFGAHGRNALFPLTRNPWDTRLTPGGSSAGSGAAVAAGICPVALGSDGGGSVRIPAAFNALVGIKASMGRVPLWPGCRDETLPGVSGWESIEHIGPLARTVADAALMLDVVAGPDPRDRHSLPSEGLRYSDAAHGELPKGLVAAYCPVWDGVPVDPRVRALTDEAIKSLEVALGCRVVEASPPFEGMLETFRATVAMETDLVGLRALATGREGDLSPGVRNFLERHWSAEDFTNAVVRRKAAVNAMARFMSRYDFLVTPTLPILPFPADAEGPAEIDGVPVTVPDSWSPYCYPANLTGQPAISLPAGFTEDGLPVGLQLIGRHLGDHRLITAAAAFERARPWNHRRPPLSA